jgi:hypothetical protein
MSSSLLYHCQSHCDICEVRHVNLICFLYDLSCCASILLLVCIFSCFLCCLLVYFVLSFLHIVNTNIIFLVPSLIQQAQKILIDMRNPNDTRNVRYNTFVYLNYILGHLFTGSQPFPQLLNQKEEKGCVEIYISLFTNLYFTSLHPHLRFHTFIGAGSKFVSFEAVTCNKSPKTTLP